MKLVEAGARKTGPEENPLNSKWTGTRCYHDGQYISDNEAEQDAAENRRNHPEAKAVYYGTPPAETGTATASKGSGQICITMPAQDSRLTTRHNLRQIGVYGTEGNYNPDVSLSVGATPTRPGGNFLHFGNIRLEGGTHCVSGRGRFQNAMTGSEFPVSLQPATVGANIDASDPNTACEQSATNTITRAVIVRNIGNGQCLQRHYAFRKMAHCAGAGASGALDAASCRIWVMVED